MNMNNNNNMNMNMNNNNSIESNGPRAKCDQVVFEAIAKAAEIIVHGRTRGQHTHGLVGSAGMAFGSNVSGANGVMMSSGSRFNLMVPEIANVRQILQRWRRALHVPLRLDLYYPNPETNQNELVERWCLEYNQSPTVGQQGQQHYSPSDLFRERECRSSDPIVQLRHVCKKIVLWLRTLYCSSRLLPAQALQHPSCPPTMQFSIYFASHGDDAHLPPNFCQQEQPTAVGTPYGQLVWRVYHASKQQVEHYLPPSHPLKAPLWKQSSKGAAATPLLRNTTAPVAIPIPRNSSMDQLSQQQQQQQQQQDLSTSPGNGNGAGGQRGMMVPQSAPAGGNYFQQYQSHTHNQQQQQQQHENNNHQNNTLQNDNNFYYHQQQHQQNQPQQQHPNNTYHAPRHHMYRCNSQHEEQLRLHLHLAQNQNAPNNNNGQHQPLSRRNTHLGIPNTAAAAKLQWQQMEHESNNNNHNNNNSSNQGSNHNGTVTKNDMEHPERLMSGLSLAMMTTENNGNEASSPNGDTAAQAEKRRAALHHAPPHLSSQQQQQQQGNHTTTGEYGYAYNNHISWNQIRPSSTVPISLAAEDAELQRNGSNNQNYSPLRQRLGSSPHQYQFATSQGAPTSSQGARLGTSPSFLVGTPPSGALYLKTTPSGTTPVNTASLLPPRNLTATPPFPTRPMGFAQGAPMPPSPLLEPKQASLSGGGQGGGLGPPALALGSPDAVAASATNNTAAPMTSLDLLHSSPFQQGASMVSINGGAGTGGGGGGASQGSLFRPPNSFWGSGHFASGAGGGGAGSTSTSAMMGMMPTPSREAAEGGEDDALSFQDMPFAVEDLEPPPSGGSNNATTTPTAAMMDAYESLSSSAAVASFAQKCAPAQRHRLKLFDSTTGGSSAMGAPSSAGGDAAMASAASDLTNQLAEFRNFGASLTLPPSSRGSVGGSDEGTNSSTSFQTPMPLRTN